MAWFTPLVFFLELSEFNNAWFGSEYWGLVEKPSLYKLFTDHDLDPFTIWKVCTIRHICTSNWVWSRFGPYVHDLASYCTSTWVSLDLDILALNWAPFTEEAVSNWIDIRSIWTMIVAFAEPVHRVKGRFDRREPLPHLDRFNPL